MAEGLSRTKSGRLCLYGPPGTGKTAFGRWMADKLEIPLSVKKGSDLISKWVGGTEKNIAMAFQEAEQDGALLLIDEVDGFLQDRRKAQHSWEVTGVNEMLTQMESFPGIFIASTNLMDGIDQAALRRFDLKLKFGYLLPEQAWKLFKRQCAALAMPAPTSNFKSRLGRLSLLTPGDFAAVARQNRFCPIETSYAFLSALEQECMVKENGQQKVIGF
jgi:SpoVK/Ycf46/Vps4 family AAA+-type ATPase